MDSSARQVTVIGVPSCAGTHGPGQELAPAALRAAGLIDRLAAAGLDVADAGDLAAVPFRTDPANRTAQNLAAVAGVVRAVDAAVRPVLAAGRIPLVLGGDCTITQGVVAAAVGTWPEAGLLYLDGDLDLSVPEHSRSGILDTMVLSHLLGGGAPQLRDIGPRTPLLSPDRVIAFGHDPAEVSDRARESLARLGFPALSCHDVGTDPAAAAQLASAAWSGLAERAGRIVLHVDVDVIDSVDFPLANFPHFNEGLSAPVGFACLRAFAARPELAALVVTEVNPQRDPSGELTDRLVGELVSALGLPPG
ncbi:MAG TPA: arginase family protein [Mycobacteriales bacterium]|nr:arginase family protein [Mycobacteriales bacterium]